MRMRWNKWIGSVSRKRTNNGCIVCEKRVAWFQDNTCIGKIDKKNYLAYISTYIDE